MKTAMKKLFSLMLVAVLLVGVMPFQAFADDVDPAVGGPAAGGPGAGGPGAGGPGAGGPVTPPAGPDGPGGEDDEPETPQEYTVTIVNKTPGAAQEEKTYTADDTFGEVLGYLGIPSADGYEFLGWTFADGSDIYKDDYVTANCTIKGNWDEIQKYVVTVHLQPGTEKLEQEVTEGTLLLNILSSINTTYEGHTFKGWYLDESGNNPLPASIVEVDDDYNIFGIWEKNSVPSTPLQPAIPTQHTLTLNANGGTVDPATITVNHGQMVERLPVPTRRGYDFLGWYDHATEGEVVRVITEMTEDVTLYARWSKKGSNNNDWNDNDTEKVDIYVNLNYDRKMGETQKNIAEGTKMSIVLRNVDEPNRRGYKFVGWYWDANGRDDVDMDDKVSEKRDTIYAKWEKKDYDHEVLLKIYLNNNTESAAKVIDLDAYVKDGKFTRYEATQIVMQYYESKSSKDDMDVDGLFTSKTWNNGNYTMRQAEEVINVDRDEDQVFFVMVRDAQRISSSTSVADSSNPKTGDAIFAPVIVLGASVTCLAVLFFLNKKRAF